MQRIGKPLDASKMKALKALPVIWQNPDLGKKQEGELKQYTIFNRSIYSSYRKISDKEKSNGLNHRYINSGGINVIVARQNPLASYYLKFPKHLVMDDPYRDVTEYDSEYDSEYDYLMDLAKLLNILNSKLCEEDPKTKAVRKHFAVEFIKEIRGSKEDPVPVFLTPAKRGFGLDSFVKEPKKYERHLPQGELKEKLDDMRKAIKWMHEAGFLHNDFQLPNFFFDVEKKAIVMIDFECAETMEEQVHADTEMDEWRSIEAIVKEAAEIDTPRSEDKILT